MCTALQLSSLCGRTLDLDYSYNEKVIVTPRGLSLSFRHEGTLKTRFAMLGVGLWQAGLPLYYDALSEAGLYMAGLNFPKSAVYLPKRVGLCNLASFELIPRLLSSCESLEEALFFLERVNLTPESVSERLTATPLHFFLADKERAVAIEPLQEGLRVTEDPFGVLTNEPDLSFHEAHLATYMDLSPAPPHNTLCPTVDLPHFSRGMGAKGLPGDWSSPSRFVRAVFVKAHTKAFEGDCDGVCRFFHIMSSVFVPYGCVLTDEGRAVYTVYTSCADTEQGIYRLVGYNERSKCQFSFSEETLLAPAPTVYPFL